MKICIGLIKWIIQLIKLILYEILIILMKNKIIYFEDKLNEKISIIKMMVNMIDENLIK